MKMISKEEAYRIYIQDGYEDVMPFLSKYEHDFVEFLYAEGIKVVEDSEENL